MMDGNDCKGCSSSVRMTEDEIHNLIEATLKTENIQHVAEDIYIQRLGICNKCSALDYGTTCRYCGCLVQVKAWLLSAKCPYPYDAKW